MTLCGRLQSAAPTSGAPARVTRQTHYVATVQWMGYALFAENMKPLDEFIEELAL